MKVFQIIIITLALIISIGCVPTKYSHVNIMEHNDQSKSGKNVDKIWIDGSAVSGLKTNKIEIGKINTDSIKDEKGITKEDCRNFLREELAKSTLNSNVLILGQDSGNYRIDFYFTNMSPGDAASRIWAGEFGFGHANVEIQAVINNPGDKRIVEISDSRNNSGAIGLRDTPGDAGPTLVKELITQISENIINEIKSIIGKN